ncbi:MAG: PD-(D/E)XK nuclease family protein [Parcubacteria group bacterium]|nr:PD-(D/E)XK nuclease family protein [Parcubacteria group bacterium]
MYILSASSLALFNECPRCFYLQVKEGVRRPQGIPMPLYNKMDFLVKDYFDGFRAKNELPPQLEGLVEGKLFDNQELLRKWRNWRTGLNFIDKKAGAKLVSALDDCLVSEDNRFLPLDYKSKGEIRDDSHIFHQNQLNIYTWLLDENGYPAKDVGYLVFFAPLKILNDNLIKFNIIPKRIETSKDSAKELFYKAVNVLNGPIPEKHENCDYCRWAGDVHDII